MANLILVFAFALLVTFAAGLLAGWPLQTAATALVAAACVFLLWSLVALSRRGQRRRRPWSHP